MLSEADRAFGVLPDIPGGRLDPGQMVPVVHLGIPGHLSTEQDVVPALAPWLQLEPELLPSVRAHALVPEVTA